jgi:hypothetical protein
MRLMIIVQIKTLKRNILSAYPGIHTAKFKYVDTAIRNKITNRRKLKTIRFKQKRNSLLFRSESFVSPSAILRGTANWSITPRQECWVYETVSYTNICTYTHTYTHTHITYIQIYIHIYIRTYIT